MDEPSLLRFADQSNVLNKGEIKLFKYGIMANANLVEIRHHIYPHFIDSRLLVNAKLKRV